jgi:hypothetical protein
MTSDVAVSPRVHIDQMAFEVERANELKFRGQIIDRSELRDRLNGFYVLLNCGPILLLPFSCTRRLRKLATSALDEFAQTEYAYAKNEHRWLRRRSSTSAIYECREEFLRQYDTLLEDMEAAVQFAYGERPSGVSATLIDVATRLLPAHHRYRYQLEFGSELADLSNRPFHERLGYAFKVCAGMPDLCASIRELIREHSR